MAAVDGMFAAIPRNAAHYRREFGAVPSFWVGTHGGDVVLSGTSDLKRAIGICGDVIHVAARIEEAARQYGLPCCVSDVVVRSLGDLQGRFRLIGMEQVRGVQAPMKVYEFEVSTPERTVKAPLRQPVGSGAATLPDPPLIAPALFEDVGPTQRLLVSTCRELRSTIS